MKDFSDLSCEFEIKSESDDAATFTGVASTCELDMQDDIVEAGAFEPIPTKTAPNGETIPNVLMLRDHDRSAIIGGWKKFQQQGDRLLVEGQLALEVAKARETYALLKRGYLGGLSVGFQVPDKSGIGWSDGGKKRHIKKAILRECSIVAFPANRSANIMTVKTEVEEWLDAHGLEPDDLTQLADILKLAPSKPHGDVTYADPGYLDHNRDQASSSGLTPVKRYPIHREANIRAAWSYINMPRNQTGYTSTQLASIKAKIVAAWKRTIDPAGPPAHAEQNKGSFEIREIDGFPAINQSSVAAALGGLLEQVKGRSHAR